MEKAKKPKNKPFKNWLFEDVAKEFGLNRVQEHPFLTEINQCTLSDSHPLREQIEDLWKGLRTYAEAWNEDELKTMFINPFVRLIGVYKPLLQSFYPTPFVYSICQ